MEKLQAEIEPTAQITDKGYMARLGTHFEIHGRDLIIDTVNEGERFDIPIFDVIEFIGACSITSAST